MNQITFQYKTGHSRFDPEHTAQMTLLNVTQLSKRPTYVSLFTNHHRQILLHYTGPWITGRELPARKKNHDSTFNVSIDVTGYASSRLAVAYPYTASHTRPVVSVLYIGKHFHGRLRNLWLS